MTGDLFDTYVAALQHDSATVPDEARLVGVVRKPTRWFHGAVDENRPSLGPPAALLEEFDARTEAFRRQGMCDEGAHNGAWDDLDFAARYREYLAGEEPRDDVADLLDLLASGRDVALVCYENTENKRCHRTVLSEYLSERL